MLWPRGVRRLRGVEFARYDDQPLLLDVYMPRGAVADEPRPAVIQVHGGGWIVGSRARAGHPAAQPPRQLRLGRLQHRLPAQPAGDLPRPHRRRQAGDRLGARARRRVRRRPGLRLHHRRLGRRPPARAGGADRRRPRLPARLRGRRHLGRRRGAVLRRLRPHQRRRRLLPASCASGCSSATCSRRRFADEPERFRAASPTYRVHADAPPFLRPPRRPRHAGPGRGRARASSRALRAVSDEPGRSTPSSPAPSTPSTSSRASARRGSSRRSSASWRRCASGDGCGVGAARCECDRLGSRATNPSGGDPWT